jgi:hypothetical protein
MLLCELKILFAQNYHKDLAFVAQGIEHRTSNPCVAGSNPAGGAMLEIIEGRSEHPKLLGEYYQFYAVDDGEVVAWSIHDDRKIALFLLKRELYYANEKC